MGSFFSAVFGLWFPVSRESWIGRAAPGAVGAALAPCLVLGFHGKTWSGVCCRARAEHGGRVGAVPRLFVTQHQISFLRTAVALPVAGSRPPRLPGKRCGKPRVRLLAWVVDRQETSPSPQNGRSSSVTASLLSCDARVRCYRASVNGNTDKATGKNTWLLLVLALSFAIYWFSSCDPGNDLTLNSQLSF